MITPDLSHRAAQHRMTLRDVRDDPPDLPSGVRVIAMYEDGSIQPWQWAEHVAWYRVGAWRTQDDGTTFVRCDLCGEATADAVTGHCERCWEEGDFEPDDGDADAAEESA